MGGKAKAPPPPDYSAVAAASEQSAKISAEVAREQLQFARERYYLDRQTETKVTEAALKRLNLEDTAAREDRARYKEKFQPLEDSLAKEAETYATDTRREEEAGKAQADVSSQFARARSAAMDRLESFGIDPSQTRASALDISTRMQEAAARASAGNQARNRVDDVGRALRSEAINVGRGYPGQIAAGYNTALQSGNQAINTSLGTTSTTMGAQGTGAQWQGNANNAIGGWWGGLNSMYANQINAFQAENQANNAWMAPAGMLAGGFARLAFSDERIKDDIEPVGETFDGQIIYRYRLKGSDKFEVGLMAQDVEKRDPGAVAEVGGIKAVDYERATEGAARKQHFEGGGAVQHSGIPVTPGVSPSGGQAIDDVPARLNVGEFIVPKDVVGWKGEEFFQKLIENSRKGKDSAGAKPQMRSAPAQDPAISTAIPTR